MKDQPLYVVFHAYGEQNGSPVAIYANIENVISDYPEIYDYDEVSFDYTGWVYVKMTIND